MKLFFAILQLQLVISSSDGAVIRFDGDSSPDSPTNAANWTTIVFAGTGWSSTGGVLNIATAFERGIWFGWADYVGDTPSWSISPNTVGNRASMRAKLLPASGEWEMYIGDPDGYFAALNLIDANTILWSYTDAAGSQEKTISLDTTEFHTYELLLKQGLSTLIVDDLVRGQAFVVPSSLTSSFFSAMAVVARPPASAVWQLISRRSIWRRFPNRPARCWQASDC